MYPKSQSELEEKQELEGLEEKCVHFPNPRRPCKSALDKLDLVSDSSIVDPKSPISGLSLANSGFVLGPILLALDSAYPKVVEPAVDCAFKLFFIGLFHGEIDTSDQKFVLFKLVESLCKCAGLGMLRTLLAAVRSPQVLIRSDCLVNIVRTCYNVYLGGLNRTNQICAKSVLAQIMVIVFTKVEEDSLNVSISMVSVNELLEFTYKNLNEGSSILFCKNFVNVILTIFNFCYNNFLEEEKA